MHVPTRLQVTAYLTPSVVPHTQTLPAADMKPPERPRLGISHGPDAEMCIACRGIQSWPQGGVDTSDIVS